MTDFTPYNAVVPDAVEQFEREFAAWLGVRGAVATGFGRSALRLALEAIDCRDADVLVPDFICSQVPEAVRQAGGRPVFYRVARDLKVPLQDFLDGLTSNARVAIVPHYFGRVLPNIGELASACRERGIVLVEDCALALRASLGVRPAGTFGDLAIFSLTKSDWCYGGGLLATNRGEWLDRALRIREEKFREALRLTFAYGLLRRADFACNRPRTTAAAARAGRWLQRLSSLGAGNFYDAGRFDAAMPPFAARCAREVLRALSADGERRRGIQQRLAAALGDASHVLLRRDAHTGDTGAFLVLHSPAGRARDWIQQAARESLTLRLTWPAYQEREPGQGSGGLNWLAGHLLLLEIHPRLSEAEVQRIAGCLRRLAARE